MTALLKTLLSPHLIIIFESILECDKCEKVCQRGASCRQHLNTWESAIFLYQHIGLMKKWMSSYPLIFFFTIYKLKG